jgi:hypothetical protein
MSKAALEPKANEGTSYSYVQHVQRVDALKPIRESLAIFDTGVHKNDNETWKVTFVPPATYRTIDFSKETDVVMGSVDNKPFTTPVMLIKNQNPQSKKYDNIVTMVNLCVASVDTTEGAVRILKTALDDFHHAGGKLNNNTSLQLVAGAAHIDTQWKMADAIKLYSQDYPDSFTLKQPKTSIDTQGGRGAVFVSREGTQIVEFKGEMFQKELAEATLVTKAEPLLPIEFLKTLSGRIPDSYTKHLQETVAHVMAKNPTDICNAKQLFLETQKQDAQIQQ